MARYKMRKRPTMDTQKANSPIASVNDSPLPFQEQHSVDDLQPADAKKLCHFCLRVACMETGAKEASSIESEMGQIYVQLIGEKLVYNDDDQQPSSSRRLISEIWCPDCAKHMRQAVQTVAMVRQANTFWTDYLHAWSGRKLAVDVVGGIIKLEVGVDPAVKMEASEDARNKQNIESPAGNKVDSPVVAKHDELDADSNPESSAHEFDDDDDADDAAAANNNHDHLRSTNIDSHSDAKKPQRKTNNNTANAAAGKEAPSQNQTKSKKSNKKNNPKVCHLCGCVYQWKLGRHMETAHSTFECDMCGRTFNHKIPLRRHFRDEHGFHRYSCDICQRPNLTRSTWLRHQDMHRPKKEHPFACDQCGNHYPTLHNLRQHVARVHVEQVVACEQCGKSFRNAVRLRDHMIRHQPKTLTCPQAGCPRMFWLVKDMKEHCRTVHEKDRKYQCAVCGKAFLVNAQLKKHHSLGRCRGAGSLDAAGNATTAAGGRGAGGRKQRQPSSALQVVPQQSSIQSPPPPPPPPQLHQPTSNNTCTQPDGGGASSMLTMLHSAHLMGALDTDPNRTAPIGLHLAYLPANM